MSSQVIHLTFDITNKYKNNWRTNEKITTYPYPVDPCHYLG